MNGKLEQDNKIKRKIQQILSTLPPIFLEFYSYMEADQKSYITIKHYIEHVRDFMEAIAQEDHKDDFYKYVTIAELRVYIASLRVRVENGKELKNSDSIQAKRWSALNCFFKFLVMDDHLNMNPMTKTKRPKDRKETPIIYLEQDEISEILLKVKDNSKPQFVNRNLAIVNLGVTTGIRVGALVQLNIEDVDFKENTIHVIEKGGKERYIKFGTQTRKILSEWLIDRSVYFDNIDTNALFISQRRQRLTTDGVGDLINKYADKINGKHITPHTMRKSTATNLAKAGVDIQTIADVLNHQNIQTTRKYAAVFNENRQKAINILDNLF